MIMTNEQKELLTMIMENKQNLEKLFKIASMKRISAKDLQLKESIEVAGITWSKFMEDESGNAFMLADTCVFSKKFGENNDWRESLIREELNNNLYKKITSELGEDAIIPITVDLFSHDGLKDYGTCADNISLLTYDLYRNNRANIKMCNQTFWTNTPNSTPSGCGSSFVRYVDSDGGVSCSWYDNVRGVRPFFILKAERSDA